MASRKQISNWKEKVLEWQESGKSVKVWCMESGISVTTFYGWKKKFNASKQADANPPSKFIELKNNEVSQATISLEFAGVRIYLSEGFNPVELKKCLYALRGILC